MTYSVNLWGSNPDETTNDDCWTGADYQTLEEALHVFQNPWDVFNALYYKTDTAYIEIDGPNSHQVRSNPSYKPRRSDNDTSDWVREMAMQNGMAFGCAGYNDTYGYYTSHVVRCCSDPKVRGGRCENCDAAVEDVLQVWEN